MAIDQTPVVRPFQASIQARLSRGGIDTIEEIDYDGGQFTRRFRVVPGHGTTAVLNDEQLRQLLTELRTELRAAPAGTDVLGLEVFADLIEDALKGEPPASTRFDQARFGSVTSDESRNVLFGHLAIGVDVVGTVRDTNHELSFEQHVAPLGPGPFRPLSPADRASLARALEASPPADQLWRSILQDATGRSAGRAQQYVRERYPDLVAAGGRISVVSSQAVAELLPRFDVFSFAVGTAHPIVTKVLARRTIVVDRGEGEVVLDLDPTAEDQAVAAALRESHVLPAADPGLAPKVAAVVAALAPLDPFWPNPTGGGFQATAGAAGTIQAVWSGERFRYEVDFTADGAIDSLARKDDRIKPI